MLLSEEYRSLNRKLHETNESYGVSGQLYADIVMNIANTLNTKDILDYGCGKRTLEKALGFNINNYDPCIAGLDNEPAPADIVVCTDVLEHIEPECLDDVLDDLKRVTKFWGLFSIATRPAKKFLADGRNAHLIQKDIKWWERKLRKRFFIQDLSYMNKDKPDFGFIALVEKKELS